MAGIRQESKWQKKGNKKLCCQMCYSGKCGKQAAHGGHFSKVHVCDLRENLFFSYMLNECDLKRTAHLNTENTFYLAK